MYVHDSGKPMVTPPLIHLPVVARVTCFQSYRILPDLTGNAFAPLSGQFPKAA